MKNCLVCKTEFHSNYKRVVTCSEACRIKRKLELKRIHSKEYYQAKKKPVYANYFLSMKL